MTRHGLALLGALFALVLLAAPVQAHAEYLGSDPADGAVVESPPEVITLSFSEAVSLRENAVRMVDATGEPVAVSAAAVDTSVRTEPSEELREGTYILSWRVISADGHPIAGATTFSIGQPSATVVEATVPTASDAASVARVIAQTAAYLGLLVWAGLMVFDLLVRSRAGRPELEATTDPVSRASRRVAVVAALLAVLGAVVSLPLTAIYQNGGDLGDVLAAGSWSEPLTADSGWALLVLVVGIAVATTLRSRLQSNAVRVVAVAAVAVALFSVVLVGHTRSYGPAWLVIGADFLHVLAAAVWLGGLVGLGLLLAATARAVDTVEVAASTRTLTRFSTLAAVLVALLAVTGSVLGWRIIGSWSALFGTAYGITLVVKVGLALLVVALAGWNRLRLLPRVLRAPGHREAWLAVRRTVGVEAIILLLVVGATGVLVGQSPRDGDPADHGGHNAGALSEPVEVAFGDGMLRLLVSPATAGTNTVEFTLTDADGAFVDPVEEPTLSLTQEEAGIGPLLPELEAVGAGYYTASVDLPVGGSWTVGVDARVSQFENPVVEVPIEVR